MWQERRESPRQPVLVRATLEFNGQQHVAVTTDVSRHGGFFGLRDCPPVGTSVVVQVEDGTGSQVRVESAVARHGAASFPGVGLSWVGSPEAILGRCLDGSPANTDTSTDREVLASKQPSSVSFEVPKVKVAPPVEPVKPTWNMEDLVSEEAVEETPVRHNFSAGMPLRFRVEGRWMVGRIRSVDGNDLNIASHWSIPLEGHVVNLAAAVVSNQQLAVSEAQGVVERVEHTGASRQGGSFRLRIIRC